MSVRFSLAKAISAVSTWGLKSVFHRPAGNFPGKMALYADPQLIAHMRSCLTEGSVIVVGTNGKTSTTNLLADAFEAWGKSTMCNRSGANLDSGVATTMLQSKGAQWGVFEMDELWMVKVLPQLKANYVLLMNLFRDQLDRVGEIDRIQESMVKALSQSPDTVLVYNADDPFCQAIANAVPNRGVAFGLAEAMESAGAEAAEAQMCQTCSHVLSYRYRQYGQLGDYACPNCEFHRADLDFAGRDVHVGSEGVSFRVAGPVSAEACVSETSLSSHQSSPYTVYNVLAAYAVAALAGCSVEAFQQAVDAFNPRNGRLQRYTLGYRSVLLNLAKNPTGFDQNLGIVRRDEAPKAVAFFVNDKEGDGRDVSWLWDVSFEGLAEQKAMVVYAGGSRKHDVAVRLKYAGIMACLVESANEMFELMEKGPAMMDGRPLPQDAGAYLIANYTALPPVHEELDAMEARSSETGVESGEVASVLVSAGDALASAVAGDAAAPAPAEVAPAATSSEINQPPIVIAQMYPELLNLNGDGGNAWVLQKRLEWRSVPVELRKVPFGTDFDLSQVDVVVIAGGPEREQRLAAEGLVSLRSDLKEFAAGGGVVLAAGGGFPLLGKTWLSGDEALEGLGLVDMRTERPASHSSASSARLVGNVVLESSLSSEPVAGYENHAGRTFLAEGEQAFGKVVSSSGCGNNETAKEDGIVRGTVLGTYLHGPVLAKSPEVADWLLAHAVEHWSTRTGRGSFELIALPDEEERAAREYAVGRFS